MTEKAKAAILEGANALDAKAQRFKNSELGDKADDMAEKYQEYATELLDLADSV